MTFRRSCGGQEQCQRWTEHSSRISTLTAHVRRPRRRRNGQAGSCTDSVSCARYASLSPQELGSSHRPLAQRVLPLPSASSLPTIPAPRDESNWRVFIDGKIRKPETPGSAADRPPMMPEPNLVTALNQVRDTLVLDAELTTLPQVTVMSVLEHLTLWLEARLETGGADTLPRNQGAWILALLAVLSDVLTADDISSLRRLARSCQAVTQRGSTDERALAWCVIVAVAGVWGQHDLLHPS